MFAVADGRHLDPVGASDTGAAAQAMASAGSTMTHTCSCSLDAIQAQAAGALVPNHLKSFARHMYMHAHDGLTLADHLWLLEHGVG